MLESIRNELKMLDIQHLRRHLKICNSPCNTHIDVGGKDFLMFCNNDYLGLANHPELVEAMISGTKRYGVGSGASHLVSGYSRAHYDLEQHLNQWFAPHFEKARSLYFSNAYMANLGVLTTLGNLNSVIFSEELNHASLIDGIRLTRGAMQIYPHRNVSALAKLLEKSSAPHKIIATDSVFSMDGVIAPVPELVELAEKHDALLIVDDTHGFGILGERGHGVLSHFNIRSPNVVYVGGFGKSAGVSGGFVVANELIIEWLIQKARTYHYTTALPPALACATLASIRLIEGDEGEKRRAHLSQLIQKVQTQHGLKHWRVPVSTTPIQPIVIGDNDEALSISKMLEEQGIWLNAIRPPSVPVGTTRLRLSLSALHTEQEVAHLLHLLQLLEQKQKLE